jgi:hypothetical protein
MNLNRKALRAKLEILAMGIRTGQTTEAELAECQAAYDALANAPQTATALAAAPTASVATRPYKQDNVVQLDDRTKAVLAELKAKQTQIDQQKTALINSLANIPDHVNAKDEVSQILALREAWKAEGDKIRHVLEHGKLPEEIKLDLPEGWADKLPKDKYVLDREMKNLKINLKRWADALAVAKSVGKQSDLKHKMIQGEIKLDVMEKLFKSL